MQVQKHDLTCGSGTSTGLPAPLIGGMNLDSPEMPVRATRRADGTRPLLSYPLARGCVKLLEGKIGSVELIGSASDTSPTGIHITLANGTSEAWVVGPRGFKPPTSLNLGGMPFSSQLVNYNAGLALGLFMLLHRGTYSDFAAATKEAVDAWGSGNELRKAQALALMADEMAYAVEDMIDGCDLLGIKCILMDREKPGDMEQVFDGGDALMQAFSDSDTLARLLESTPHPKNTCVGADTEIGVISFVGELPTKLIDCIRRVKHVLLTGPTATGKTLAVEEACIALGSPLTVIKGSEGLEDRDLVASVSLVNGDTVTHYGPIPQAMLIARRQHEMHIHEIENAALEGREPKIIPPSVLLIDEINRLQTRHQNFLVSMLNVRKCTRDYYLRIPDTNEEITCPDGFLVVIAARNIGNAFAGTNSMDLALERRFYKKIDLSYLPPEQEATLVQSRTGLDEQYIKVLVKVAQDTRYQLSQLKAPLDTDTLLKWAEELAWLHSTGGAITDALVMEAAKDVVFDIVLERSERGGFDQAGEAILIDNISENYRDVFVS